MTAYTVSTHECCWNAAHTNRVAHVRLERKLRGEKADDNTGWCEDVSDLVHWLDGYRVIQTPNRERPNAAAPATYEST